MALGRFVRQRPVRYLAIVALVLSLAGCQIELRRASDEARCDPPTPLKMSSSDGDTGSFVTTTRPAGDEQVLAHRFDNCICARIAVFGLVEPGDNLFEETVVKRTKLYLDGAPLDIVLVLDYLGDYTITEQAGWPEGATAGFGGPFEMCWNTGPISTGVHQAEVTFTRTSGRVERYSWEFELVSK